MPEPATRLFPLVRPSWAHPRLTEGTRAGRPGWTRSASGGPQRRPRPARCLRAHDRALCAGKGRRRGFSSPLFRVIVCLAQAPVSPQKMSIDRAAPPSPARRLDSRTSADISLRAAAAGEQERLEAQQRAVEEVQARLREEAEREEREEREAAARRRSETREAERKMREERAERKRQVRAVAASDAPAHLHTIPPFSPRPFATTPSCTKRKALNLPRGFPGRPAPRGGAPPRARGPSAAGGERPRRRRARRGGAPPP